MHVAIRSTFLISVLLLTACGPQPPVQEARAPKTAEAPAKVAQLPEKPSSPDILVAPALALVIEQEVSSQSAYNRLYARPTDGGGGQSGVTTGIGYDYSVVSRSRALSDWADLRAIYNQRLSETCGLSGPAARAVLPKLQDILVPWSIALAEFKTVDVPRYWAECQNAFAGFDDLRPNAQGAVFSVVYNRGSSTVGPSRVDIRSLRTAIVQKDYDAMADAVRHMLVTMRAAWQSAGIYEGMKARRNAEADLILKP